MPQLFLHKRHQLDYRTRKKKNYACYFEILDFYRIFTFYFLQVCTLSYHYSGSDVTPGSSEFETPSLKPEVDANSLTFKFSESPQIMLTVPQNPLEVQCRDSPGSVKLHQPQTVTLHHLSVEVGGCELHNIVAGGVQSLHRQEQRAAQHS